MDEEKIISQAREYLRLVRTDCLMARQLAKAGNFPRAREFLYTAYDTLMSNLHEPLHDKALNRNVFNTLKLFYASALEAYGLAGETVQEVERERIRRG